MEQKIQSTSATKQNHQKSQTKHTEQIKQRRQTDHNKQSKQREQRLLKVTFLDVGFLFALIGYYFLNQAFGVGLPCIFHEITGLLCPGCGITRCLFAILRLDFKAAFEYNQLVILLLPFLLTYCILWQYTYVTDQPAKFPRKTLESISIVLIIISIIFGVIRNL